MGDIERITVSSRRGTGTLARASLLLIGCFVVALVAVRPPGHVPVRAATQGASPAELRPAANAASYDRGHWRLADPMVLAGVPIWMSHVLIRYQGTNPFVPFHDGWAEPSAPTRTRDEAHRLAWQVYERARANPSGFAELAREMSDDAATALQGGSWGGIAAAALTRDAAILDAVAAMAPGEISRPVTTRYGVHILMRTQPPPFEVVSGRIAVVPYTRGPNCLEGASSEACPRPRGEALSEAQSLMVRLRAAGGTTDAKTESLGTWTTWDAGELSREREMLGRMRVGEVSEPIESAAGLEVLQRVEAQAGPEYRIEVIQLRYFAKLPPGQRYSRDSERKLAESIQAALVESPGRFQEFRDRHCCRDVRVWRVGRERRELTDAVASIADGAPSGQIVEDESSFLIARRLSAAPQPEPVPPLELPQPDLIDVLHVAKAFGGDGIQEIIRKVGSDTGDLLGLAPAEAEWVKSVHESLATPFAAKQDISERQDALMDAHDAMKQRLSAEQFDRYWSLFTQRMTARVMALH